MTKQKHKKSKTVIKQQFVPEINTKRPLNSRKINRYHIGFIALFSFLLYSNTLFFSYALDDTLVITQNSFTKEGFSGIKKILTKDSFVGFLGENKNLLPGGRYRPLSQITFAVEYALLGLNPFVGHLINVLLYLFLCVLLFLILKRLLLYNQKAEWYLSLPFIATILFASHPIHTEVVANIKGRDEIMGLTFVFASILLILKYLESQNSRKKAVLLAGTFVCFFLALMSKENAATFLLVIPVTLYFFQKKPFIKKTISVIPLLLALLVFIYIRSKALGFLVGNKVEQTELLNNPYVNATASEKYATIFFTLWKYIKLLVFPHPLTHDYYPKQIPIINWSDYRAFLPLLLYIGLILFCVWGFFRKNFFAFGIIIYLACLSIASNLAFNVGTFMNERFVFAASLGFCLILAYYLLIVLPNTKIHKSFPKLTQTILIIVIGLYSVKTFSRNFVWKNDLTLFTTDAKTSVNSAKVNVSAGNALLEEAKTEKNEKIKTALYNKAKMYLLKALKIYPENIAAWVILGSNYVYLEDYAQAINCYENCLRISKTYPYAITNLNSLGQISFKNKKFDISIRSYKTLLKYQGEKAETYYWLGLGYSEKNNLDSALLFLNLSVKTDSNYYQSYNKMGEIFGKQKNDIKSSLLYLSKAYKIKPDDIQVLQNLGVAYGISGNYNESVAFLSKAIKKDSTNYELYLNLGGTYMGLKDIAKAKECFTKAEQIKSLKNKK
jgi:protein O-mannosyl-transferase